ncbi:12494_t:CDS:1, partial [Gigaspora rosea]
MTTYVLDCNSWCQTIVVHLAYGHHLQKCRNGEVTKNRPCL